VRVPEMSKRTLIRISASHDSRSNEDMASDHCKPYKTSQFVGWKISLPPKLNAIRADTALAL